MAKHIAVTGSGKMDDLKGWSDLQELLSNQVEENVVEVVRCEQCSKAYPHLNGRWCKVHQVMMRNTDYCSQGELNNG